MTDKQPDALHYATALERDIGTQLSVRKSAAAELRRLHDAHEFQLARANEFLTRIAALEKALGMAREEPPQEKYQYGTPLLDAMTGKSARQEQQCAHGIDQKECSWCSPARQEQEPVAHVDHRIHGWPDCVVMQANPPHTSPLYTAPPARQWVCDNCGAKHDH